MSKYLFYILLILLIGCQKESPKESSAKEKVVDPIKKLISTLTAEKIEEQKRTEAFARLVEKGQQNSQIRTDIAKILDPQAKIYDKLIYQLNIMGEKAVPVTEDIVQKSRNSEVRKDALKILAGGGDKAFAALLRFLPISLDMDIEPTFMEIIAKSGHKVIPELIKILDTKSSYIAECRAPLILGKMREKAVAALPILIKRAEMSDDIIGSRSVEAIGNIGPVAVTAIPNLIKILQNRHYSDAKIVVKALVGIGPKAKPSLMAILQDKNNDKRHLVIDGLVALKAQKAVPVLLEMLKDEKFFFRSKAISALYQIAGNQEPIVLAIAQSLQDKDSLVRRDAAKILAQIKPQQSSIIHLLIKGLDDKSNFVRKQVCHTLGEIGSGAKTAIPNLIQVYTRERDGYKEAEQALAKIITADSLDILSTTLKSADQYGRTYIFNTIQKLDVPVEKKIPLLIDLFQSNSWKLRAAVARAMGKLGDKGVSLVPILLKATYKDTWINVRDAAKEAVIKIGPKALPHVMKVIREGLDSRYSAISILASWGEKSAPAVPLLIDVLKTGTKFSIKQEAAIALGKIGTPAADATPILLELCEEFHVKKYAKKAIIQIGEAAVPTLVKALQEEKQRYQAVMLLGEIGPKATASVDVIITMLAQENDNVKIYLIKALGRINSQPKKSVAALMKYIENPNHIIRQETATTLGHFKAEAIITIPTLITVLKNKKEDYTVRRNIASTLGKMGPGAASAVPALVELLKEKPHFMWNILRSIGEIGFTADYIPAVAPCLKDKNADVRQEAAKILCSLGSEAATVLPDIIELLHDESRTVKIWTSHALPQIGAKVIVPLTEKLEDKDQIAGLLAAFILIHLQQRDKAEARLLKGLKSPEKKIYEMANLLTRHLGDKAVFAAAFLEQEITQAKGERRSEMQWTLRTLKK